MEHKKQAIKNIVWKELETLKVDKDSVIEFKLGRKNFELKRVK